jgi:hypothetical protein
LHHHPGKRHAAFTRWFRTPSGPNTDINIAKLPEFGTMQKKIPHHIKLVVHAWSTKYRWNQKLITQFSCTLRDEHFEPN